MKSFDFNNKRSIILLIVAVIVTMVYFSVISPYSDTGTNNLCQDSDTAMIELENEKDTHAIEKFAKKRLNSCKKLLRSRHQTKDIYKKMDNCDLFEDAASASGFYVNIALQNKNYDGAKAELNDYENYMKPFSYCPQYAGLKMLYDGIKEKNNF